MFHAHVCLQLQSATTSEFCVRKALPAMLCYAANVCITGVQAALQGVAAVVFAVLQGLDPIVCCAAEVNM